MARYTRYGDRGLADRSLGDRAYGAGGGTGPVTGVHLLNGLQNYYTLDDVQGSGSAVDSVGGVNLITFGGPLNAPGKINNGCNFQGNQNLHVVVPATVFQVTGSFFFSIWVKFNALPVASLAGIITKFDGTSNDYYVAYDTGNTGTNGWRFGVNTTNLFSGNVGDAVAGQWYHLVAWYDMTDQKSRLRINDSVTYVSASSAPPVQGTAEFNVGTFNVSPYYFLNAIGDELGFWKGRIPTASEITTLFNGGNGWPFSSFTP